MRGDGRRKSAVTDSVTENIPPPVARPVVRVKRRGKSPPPGAQATGHDKPRVVQDRTEDTRRLRPLRKERNPRVIVALRSRGPSLSRVAAEKWSSGGLRAADRIRLRIGHPKPPRASERVSAATCARLRGLATGRDDGPRSSQRDRTEAAGQINVEAGRPSNARRERAPPDPARRVIVASTKPCPNNLGPTYRERAPEFTMAFNAPSFVAIFTIRVPA